MPKQLNSRCKELIVSLITHFEQERDNGGPMMPLNCVRERVAAALNLGKSTVSAISLAAKRGEALKSPKKSRCRTKITTNTEILDVSAIRNTIYDMYEKSKFLLKNIGFRWKKDDPRRGLMELPTIAFKHIAKKK
ncbi:hypothetical protein ABEB36_015601 [Hypothenemus hampei]|uniref:Uncharacterized protein n=1 Tax=Hypothenemus hampei TaxID=57062 RepID=A0ABD1E402_HYPHA